MGQNFYVRTKDFHIEVYTLKKPQSDMHYHHAYELYYVLEGEREYFIGDRFFKVKKNDLVWVPKDMLHRTDGKGATRFLVFFNEAFLHRFYRDELLAPLLSGEPFVFHGDSQTDARLRFCLDNLLALYKSAQTEPLDQQTSLLCAGYLFWAIFLIGTSENRYLPADTSNQRISTIVRYINENYMHISGIEEIAEHFFISKYYLCHLFHESLGVSFVTYLNVIRIRAACDLLKDSDLKLADIATQSGFNSLPYFCKVFKDEKGMTPTEYRKRTGQKSNLS